MFVELIGTIVAGIACAGIVMLLNRITGRRLPKWMTPVAAGLGMVAMTISNEYTWYDRTTEILPSDVVVAMTVEEQSWLRPWTQIWPYTKRFVAVDKAATLRSEAAPDQRLTDLYFFGRWSPVNKAPVLFDCATSQSAVMIDGASFSSTGLIENAEFRAAPSGDPVLKLVCEL